MLIEEIDKAILKFHEAEYKITENFFAVVGGEPPIYPTPAVEKLWFAGIKRWGRKWSNREYELKEWDRVYGAPKNIY